MAPVEPKKARREMHQKSKEYRKKWKQEKMMKKLAKLNGTNEPKAEADKTDETIEYKPSSTLSIAVPGSILANAQSAELRTYLAGQVARAACIYNVDEIVVFDDKGDGGTNKGIIIADDLPNKYCLKLARILQYLECPQYLRKYIFPIHNDLQYAGLLNPLNSPHHLLRDDNFPFREGIVSDVPVKENKGSYVNIGLWKDIVVDKKLTPLLRVTVKLDPKDSGKKKRYGKVVPPSQPKTELGIYWGYNVRLAESLGDVIANSPYKGGYDLTIGTSEKGAPIDEIPSSSLKEYKHPLVVFGGLDGLEAALEADDKLSDTNDVTLLFDKYLNTCPSQGSRIIRTEEAMLITLAELRRLLY